MSVAIRRYADADHAAVRDLFIRVNRELRRENIVPRSRATSRAEAERPINSAFSRP